MALNLSRNTKVYVSSVNGAPTAGDEFHVMDSEQEAKKIASKRAQLQRDTCSSTRRRLN